MKQEPRGIYNKRFYAPSLQTTMLVKYYKILPTNRIIIDPLGILPRQDCKQ